MKLLSFPSRMGSGHIFEINVPMNAVSALIALGAIVFALSGCRGNIITSTAQSITEDPTDEGGITPEQSEGNISIVFSESGAQVSGDEMGIVSVSGNDVTVNNGTEASYTYILSGSCSDGFFKLYSSAKQVIVLQGLRLTNPSGAAINNQSHKYTAVILEGENFLADGALSSGGTYPDETSDEDMKAAFFSEGQLIFSGTGSLKVTATGKAGITSDDYIRITETPSITISSAGGHGLRGQEKVLIEGGTLSITASATGKKGISTDGTFYQSGGSVTIVSTSPAGTVDGEVTGAAGIKADGAVTIEGGELSVSVSGSGAKGISCDGEGRFTGGTVTAKATGSNYGSSSSGGSWGGGSWGGWGGSSSSSSDDSKSAKALKFEGNLYFDGATVTASASSHEAIESKGTITISAGSVSATSSDDAVNSGGDMTVSGGSVYAFSSGNDGLDANGNMYIQGGYVYAVGSGSPEVALDANTEQRYKLYVSGGSLVAFGGLESGASITQPVVSVSSWSANTQYKLYNGDSLLLDFTSPSKGGSGMTLSHPDLVSGSSYTLKYGSTSTTVTASLSASSSGGGWSGGGGGPGGRH